MLRVVYIVIKAARSQTCGLVSVDVWIKENKPLKLAKLRNQNLYPLWSGLLSLITSCQTYVVAYRLIPIHLSNL